jgi:hypothetical protein
VSVVIGTPTPEKMKPTKGIKEPPPKEDGTGEHYDSV